MSNYTWLFLANMIDKYEKLLADAIEHGDDLKKKTFLESQLTFYQLAFRQFKN